MSAPAQDFLGQLTDLCTKILLRANAEFLITAFTSSKKQCLFWKLATSVQETEEYIMNITYCNKLR